MLDRGCGKGLVTTDHQERHPLTLRGRGVAVGNRSVLYVCVHV